MKDMKKLIAIAVAAAALNASATVTVGTNDFENTTVWTGNIIDGNSLKPAQWFEANVAPFVQDMDQETAVMSYGGDVPKPEVDALDSSYDASGNSRYLAVDCVKPLLMQTYANQIEGVAIDDGAYISMLAKFTPYDSLPDVEAGDKLHVWMASATNGTGGVTRQLVVTAAKIEGGAVQRRDYAVTVDGVGGSDEWDGDTWHSVLFKVYKAVGSSGASAVFPAVVVFVDGKVATIKGVLSYDANKMIEINSTDLSVGDADFQALVTDDALAAKLGANQLFPSLVTGTENTTAEYHHNKIRHIAFLGTGSIDNIRIDSSDPLDEGTLSSATLEVRIDGSLATSENCVIKTNGTTVVGGQDILPGQEVLVTLSLEEGFNIGSVSFTGGSAQFNAAAGTVTLTMPNPLYANKYTLAVTTITDDNYVARVGVTSYEDLADAIKASSAGQPAVLLKDLVLSDYEVDLDGGTSAVLDFAGHEISAGAGVSDAAIIVYSGALKIVDSGSTGKIVSPDVPAIYATEAQVTIEGGTFEGGLLADDGTETYLIAGGKYLATLFTDADSFSLDNAVVQVSLVLSGDYWVPSGSSSDEWPDDWNGGNNAGLLEEFKAWIANNDPDAPNAEKAFLLGLDVDEYTDDLEAATIVIVNGSVRLTGNYELDEIRGKVFVDRGTTPGSISRSSTPVEPDSNGVVTIEPTVGAEAEFYKLRVGYPTP